MKVLKSPKKKSTHKPPEKLQVGDRVYVISFDQNGTALTEPDKNKEVMVQMGSMKIKVPLSELMLDDTPKPKNETKTVSTKVKAGKSQYIGDTGSRIGAEGVLGEDNYSTDKYLDDAYLSGLKQVMIIHGKGTGALRSAVQVYLKTNPHVKSYRAGVYGEGEMGVTVVELH